MPAARWSVPGPPLPARPPGPLGTVEAWMGDVYRLVWFIVTFCQQPTYRTIASNHGQAVVWQRRREQVPERLLGEVAGLPFAALETDVDVLRLAAFGRIVREVRRDLGHARP